MLESDVAGVWRTVGHSWKCASERHSESWLRWIVGNLVPRCSWEIWPCHQEVRWNSVRGANTHAGCSFCFPKLSKKTEKDRETLSIFLYLSLSIPIFSSQGWFNIAIHGPEMFRTWFLEHLGSMFPQTEVTLNQCSNASMARGRNICHVARAENPRKNLLESSAEL